MRLPQVTPSQQRHHGKEGREHTLKDQMPAQPQASCGTLEESLNLTLNNSAML